MKPSCWYGLSVHVQSDFGNLHGLLCVWTPGMDRWSGFLQEAELFAVQSVGPAIKRLMELSHLMAKRQDLVFIYIVTCHPNL